MKLRYTFRFTPTAPQTRGLARIFGACRYVYNWGLRLRTDAYREHDYSLRYNETSALLTKLKRTPDHAWLQELSSVPPQQALRHLQRAFTNFFEKRSRYPTLKKKTGLQSAEYTRSAFTWDPRARILTLAGIGPLKVRWSRPFSSIPTTVTVRKDAAQRYFVTLCLDEEVQKLEPVHQAVGIDLGITALATLSTGKKIGNPRLLERFQRQLQRAQRNLSRKKKGSKRRAAQRLRVARLHARISDARADFLHKTTTELVERLGVIAIEDLHVRGLSKNHALARALGDASLGQFRRMLEYKCAWVGRELRLVDRFYPSSKQCFDCKHVLEDLPLGCREWTCPQCGAEHDRDVNAAKNILAAGQAVTARGGKVRPRRGSIRRGASLGSANHPESLHRAS